MKEQYAEIVAGCLAAFDSLKRGETHERSNKMMTRTAAKNAAFLLPELRPASEKTKMDKNTKTISVVRIVGSCWEFPDGQRIPDFWKADQKAKALGMSLERHQKWRFSETE
ncbi:hypothetical protein [Serratia entomophila]|uniref:hypothetical protein n=1 Tax=Serratia entomophila TaxID=42906 RepID=UPI001F48A3BB|nr:hypothetical protein [Serratia entomophila]UIW19277.1 hypothetical protein KHA73_04820 [Serratia entomophila]UIW19460.1 hypothetical protein KHA73_05785 [Serratia entomophila]